MTNTPPTSQQLDDIEGHAGAATPGSWGVYEYGNDGSVTDITAEVRRLRALVAAATAVHEKGEHNGLAICLHCASQMFPPPETGIWSESAWPCATVRALGATDEAPTAVPAVVETGE